MANFREDILAAADGEEIVAVVIGRGSWNEYNMSHVLNYNVQPKGKVITWEEAQKWLDYDYDAGYGAPACNAIYAWTATRVLFVSQYDGSTMVHSIPRNPVDVMPEMPGG